MKNFYFLFTIVILNYSVTSLRVHENIDSSFFSYNSSDHNLSTGQIIQQFHDNIELMSKKLHNSNKIMKHLINNVTQIKETSAVVKHKLDLYEIKTQYQWKMVLIKLFLQMKLNLEDNMFKYVIGIDETKENIVNYDNQIKVLSELKESNLICSGMTNCKDCTGNPYCGWCSSENKCTSGNELGPMKTQCEGYTYNKCPGKDCSLIANCKECLEDVTCGWCDGVSSQMCISTKEDKKCNFNLFYTKYHKEIKNNKCPQVNNDNFLPYIENKLSSIEDYNIINNNNNEKNKKTPNEESLPIHELKELKLKSQLNLDKLYKNLNSTGNDLNQMEECITILEDSIKLNTTIKSESNILKIKFSSSTNFG